MKNKGESKREYVTSQDGARIAYDSYIIDTNKAPLILLHGATGDASSWYRFSDILHKQHYSTIAIDLRGHGFSDRSDKSSFYKVDRIVEDILAVIQKEKLKEYILVGQCYGASIMLKVASTMPVGMKALVVMNTSYKNGLLPVYSKLPFKKQLISIIERLPNVGKPGQTDFTMYKNTGNFHIPRILTTVWKTTLKSTVLTFDKVFSLNTEKELKNIKCPICVIGGTKDVFYPPRTIYALTEKLKDPEVYMIKDADHIMCLNRPDDVTKILFTFLNKVD